MTFKEVFEGRNETDDLGRMMTYAYRKGIEVGIRLALETAESSRENHIVLAIYEKYDCVLNGELTAMDDDRIWK